MVRATFLLMLLLLLAHASANPALAPRSASNGPAELPEGARLSALLTDVRLAEISGLAVSRRHPGIVWVHNDSGASSALFAVDAHGRVRARLDLPVPNVDWEDLASFERDGRAFLLVADTGDNGGLRRELALHLVEEPEALEDGRTEAVRTIRFRWPDGPRDCEAVAVDAGEGAVYLVSKKRVPPELFRLPLFPDDAEAVQVAEPLGTLAGILQPSAEERENSPVYGKYRGQITAADIRTDGDLFAVMSYRYLYLWPRHAEGWAQALRQPPRRLDLPWMAQAEGMGFDAQDDALWISSERLPAPLIHYWLGTDGERVTTGEATRLAR